MKYTLEHSERMMKVVNQKDDKNKPIIWDQSCFNYVKLVAT